MQLTLPPATEVVVRLDDPVSVRTVQRWLAGHMAISLVWFDRIARVYHLDDMTAAAWRRELVDRREAWLLRRSQPPARPA